MLENSDQTNIIPNSLSELTFPLQGELVLSGLPLSDEEQAARQKGYEQGLRTASFLLGTVIAEKEAENNVLEQEASINPVSGFYNERGLQRRFDKLLEANPTARLAVFAVDLGSFKAVNDALGHHRGDELLREVGKLFRITDIEAIVANPHGDEFVIVTPLEARENAELSDEDRIAAVIGRLKGMGSLLTLQDAELARLGFSISAGGVVHEPGATLKETLEKADSEMYRDKQESLPALTPEQQARIDALNTLYDELDELGVPKRQADKYLGR